MTDSSGTQQKESTSQLGKLKLTSKPVLFGFVGLLVAVCCAILLGTGVVSFGDKHPKATYETSIQPILDEQDAIFNRVTAAPTDNGLDPVIMVLNEAITDEMALRTKAKAIKPGTAELKAAHSDLLQSIDLRLKAFNTLVQAFNLSGADNYQSMVDSASAFGAESAAKRDSFDSQMALIKDPE